MIKHETQPKLEKPVVPQFVADWYEEHKDNFECNLYDFFLLYHKGRLQKDLYDWFTTNSNKPIETLVKMKLFGYEIEKEKLYTVEIPSHGNPDHVVLRKYVNGEVCIDYYLFDSWRDYKCTHLTESEIKQDFDWAWKFAEEVEV